MTQEQSEVVHEVMKRGASCGLPNDSPVSAARCSFATRDDHIAADTGPLDETGPGVPSAPR